MDVRELARRLNAKYPSRDWDQQCQRLVWNVSMHNPTGAVFEPNGMVLAEPSGSLKWHGPTGRRRS